MKLQLVAGSCLLSDTTFLSLARVYLTAVQHTKRRGRWILAGGRRRGEVSQVCVGGQTLKGVVHGEG